MKQSPYPIVEFTLKKRPTERKAGVHTQIYFSDGISLQVEQHLVLKFNLVKIVRYGVIVRRCVGG